MVFTDTELQVNKVKDYFFQNFLDDWITSYPFKTPSLAIGECLSLVLPLNPQIQLVATYYQS